MDGRTFSASSRGTLTRTVSSFESGLSTRMCSQRSCLAGSEDFPELFCEKPEIGVRAIAAANSARAGIFLVRSVMWSASFADMGTLEVPDARLRGKSSSPAPWLHIRGSIEKCFQEFRVEARWGFGRVVSFGFPLRTG